MPIENYSGRLIGDLMPPSGFLSAKIPQNPRHLFQLFILIVEATPLDDPHLHQISIIAKFSSSGNSSCQLEFIPKFLLKRNPPVSRWTLLSKWVLRFQYSFVNTYSSPIRFRYIR